LSFLGVKKVVFLRMLIVRENSFFQGKVKSILGFKAKARDVRENGERYQLREKAASYMTLFKAEKNDIGTEKAHVWDVNAE
jgi:hypothetical protein